MTNQSPTSEVQNPGSFGNFVTNNPEIPEGLQIEAYSLLLQEHQQRLVGEYSLRGATNPLQESIGRNL